MTQKGMVIWLLGLSGAGKSTLAKTMAKLLADKGFITVLLDGDDLRSGINKDLTFSESDRLENIRRAAEIAKILVQNNIIVICSFITPLREQRDLARSIIGAGYFEVFVSCPLEVCEQRDVKGLYKKARNKEIIDFTGIQARFDIPSTSDLVITTDRESPEQSAGRIFRGIQDYA
ncbi:MAG: adenylyl-sulfate kinase [Sphingobacteriales bacterium 50-39]|nr:MAG: adenylyl-sulfate kinase [Sphingobacteriales bacterium 50-39]